MDFLDKIKKYCDEHHISQAQLAKEAGLSNGLIPKWKNKGFYPSYKSQKKLAAYMNMTVEELMRSGSDESVLSKTHQPDFVCESAVRYIPVLTGTPGDGPVDPLMVKSYLPALAETVDDPDRCYAMEMPDSSMLPEYCAGDILIVMKCSDPVSGDIVIADTPGEGPLCRKLIRKEDCIILQPYNSRHYDAVCYRYEEMEELPVVFSGNVIGMIRDIKSSSDSVTE